MIGVDHAGDALVDLLCAHGVEVVFGLPGGQTNALYDAIDRDDRIDHRDVLDERSAAYAADAYARLTGKVGVCDATVGPGAAKLPSGLGEAFNSSVPVIAIVSDLPTATAGRRHRGATSQALDQEALLAPVTKWVEAVRRPEHLGPIVRRAFREATSGRPGPVAVVVPQDILEGPRPDADQSDDPHAPRFGRFPSTPSRPSPADVSTLTDLIDAAERPMAVLGGGVDRGVGPEAVSRLLDAGVAVATTLSGKGLADERHSCSVGVLGSLGTPAASATAAEADLVVLLGTKWGSGTTLGWTLPASHQRIAQIDIDPVELGRDAPVELAICADAATVLAQLGTLRRHDEWQRRVGGLVASWHADRGRSRRSDAVPIDPSRIMGELQELLHAGDIVIADASLSSGWVGSYLDTRPDGPRMLFPRGLAGLGWAIPAAIGAAEAGADRIVTVLGDGAAPYAIGELATLAAGRVPVLVVVLNNSSYGWIRWYRRIAYGRGWEEPDLPETRFADVASGYGLAARRVDAPAEIGEALREGIGHTGLVEFVTAVWETPIDAHRRALEDRSTPSY